MIPVALCDTVVTVFVPVSSVPRRSQLLREGAEQMVIGILPSRSGFKVSDKVDRDDGKEAGTWVKALLCRYLNVFQHPHTFTEYSGRTEMQER